MFPLHLSSTGQIAAAAHASYMTAIGPAASLRWARRHCGNFMLSLIATKGGHYATGDRRGDVIGREMMNPAIAQRKAHDMSVCVRAVVASSHSAYVAKSLVLGGLQNQNPLPR